jgi:hypothetical protein
MADRLDNRSAPIRGTDDSTRLEHANRLSNHRAAYAVFGGESRCGRQKIAGVQLLALYEAQKLFRELFRKGFAS